MGLRAEVVDQRGYLFARIYGFTHDTVTKGSILAPGLTQTIHNGATPICTSRVSASMTVSHPDRWSRLQKFNHVLGARPGVSAVLTLFDAGDLRGVSV